MLPVTEKQHICGSHKGKRRGDYPVAGLSIIMSDSGGAHAQVQSSRSRADSNCVPGAGQLAEGSFEGFDLVPHAQVGRTQHCRYRLAFGLG
jgi:hypothetical protein